MRRAWIFVALALGALPAAGQAPASIRNAYRVQNLPTCTLSRQGWTFSINNANPDCQTLPGGAAGSNYKICQCDPLLGWLTYDPGDGYIEGATAGGGLELDGVTLGIRTDCDPAEGLAWDGNSWECAAASIGPTNYAGSASPAGPATSALSVTGFTASKCARFNGSGVLVAASADCSAGDTSNAGTVTNVAASVPSWLAVSGSPVTTTGTLAISAATGQTSHRFIGTCDAATSFGPCAIVAADLPTIPYSQISGAPAAGIGGTVGSTDNAVPRADGTGTATLQGSGVTIDDNGRIQAGNGANGGINLGGSGARISDSNNDGRLDFFTAGSTRLDIVDLGGYWALRFVGGGPIRMGSGANAQIGNGAEGLTFGGGNGTTWNMQGSGGSTQVGAWAFGDYSGISRGPRFYRSVQVSTAGSGSPLVLVEADTWKVLHNEGATAEAYFTLPSAAAGLSATFIVSDADGLRITAATGDVIHIGGLGALGVDLPSSPGGECHSATVANSVTLQAVNATDWFATSVVGLGWSCS